MKERNRFNMTKKNQQIAVNFIQILQEKYPITFPSKPSPKVPLMVGILKQLLGVAEELGVDEKTIGRALKLWCMGARYWMSLTVIGSPRFDLYGNKVGFVTKEQVVGIRKKLKLSPVIIDKTIEDLKLSVRTYNCLKREGINFVSEVKSKINELHLIKGMGKKSLDEVKSALN